VVKPPPRADAVTATIGQLTLHIGSEMAVIEGPPGCGQAFEVAGDAEALREFARTDELGRYRPLPGARTLRGSWWAAFSDLESVSAAVEAIYPLAQRHQADWLDGELRIVSLDEVLERQQGRYRTARDLSEAGRRRSRHVLCGLCIKTPVWAGAVVPTLDVVPCPEPCSVFVSLCREGALWEQDRPTRADPSRDVAFAAFDEPGNEVREAWLAVEETER
jgi:hypothetical protein